MSPTTLVRGRLRDHPLWSRALAAPEITGRLIQPVIVSARVEDRERVEDAPFLERLSITELVRDAREAASTGLAGFLIFASSDRKDELALLASERDHIVARAIHAVKDAAPDLAIATDVCVCAYTPHGQCVLFSEGQANIVGTLDSRLIAAVHADAADLLIPSGSSRERARLRGCFFDGPPGASDRGEVKLASGLRAPGSRLSGPTSVRALIAVAIATARAAALLAVRASRTRSSWTGLVRATSSRACPSFDRRSLVLHPAEKPLSSTPPARGPRGRRARELRRRAARWRRPADQLRGEERSGRVIRAGALWAMRQAAGLCVGLGAMIVAVLMIGDVLVTAPAVAALPPPADQVARGAPLARGESSWRFRGGRGRSRKRTGFEP